MENSITKTENIDDVLKSKSQEVDILRKAYELILENSSLFYEELGKAFMNENEKGEFDFTI